VVCTRIETRSRGRKHTTTSRILIMINAKIIHVLSDLGYLVQLRFTGGLFDQSRPKNRSPRIRPGDDSYGHGQQHLENHKLVYDVLLLSLRMQPLQPRHFHSRASCNVDISTLRLLSLIAHSDLPLQFPSRIE